MSGKIMRVSANGGCLGIIIVFMCPSLCINSPGRSRYSFLCFTLFKTYCVLRNIHTYIIMISVLLHKIHLIRLELQVHLGFTWYSGIAEHIGIAFYCYKGKIQAATPPSASQCQPIATDISPLSFGLTGAPKLGLSAGANPSCVLRCRIPW